MRIKEKLESVNNYFLKGFQIKDLSVYTDAIDLPLDENLTVEEQLKDGDTIYCNIYSDEIRIEVDFKIRLPHKLIKASFFAKFARTYTLESTLRDLFVRGLDILAEELKNSDKLHCLVKSCTVVSINAIENFEIDIGELCAYKSLINSAGLTS